eukprot:459072-Alexandrium_andersonii.AAC.1
MSASLVGSEMCIRDRRSTPWRSSLNKGWARLVKLAHNGRVHVGLTFSTVSYTHLTLPTICSV